MKKYLYICLILVATITLFAGCNQKSNNETTNNASTTQEETVTKDENPIEGNWLGKTSDVGYFEFTENEFKWFKDQNDKNDNYYYGTYTYVEGALRNNGKYDLGEKGEEIFTVTMKYKGSKINGTVVEKESDGAFTIQRMGTKDKLYVKNHRTNGWFEMDKVE